MTGMNWFQWEHANASIAGRLRLLQTSLIPLLRHHQRKNRQVLLTILHMHGPGGTQGAFHICKQLICTVYRSAAANIVSDLVVLGGCQHWQGSLYSL